MTSPEIAWKKTTSFKPLAIATSSDGFIYVAGDYYSSTSNSDPYFSKYTANGTLVFSRTLVGSDYDWITDIKVAGDGSIYLTGSTSSRTFDGQVNTGNSDVFIAKYSSSGTKQWVSLIGSAQYEDYPQLAIGANGSITVTGYTTGSLNGLSRIGGMEDIFIASYNPDGKQLWLKLFGTMGSEWANDIAAATDGGYYIAGQTTGSFASTKNSGSYDALLSKVDSQGNLQWSRLLGGAGSDRALSVVSNATGVYVTWNNEGISQTGFLTKFSVAGVKLWEISLPAVSATTYSYLSIFLDSSSNVFVCQNTLMTSYNASGQKIWESSVTSLGGSLMEASLTPDQSIVLAYSADKTGTLVEYYYPLIDTKPPTIAIQASTSGVVSGGSITINFNLSENSVDFTAADLYVSAGVLSNFKGSGQSYSATFTPTDNSILDGVISVSNRMFSDSAGNFNSDAADADNMLTITVNTLHTGNQICGTSGFDFLASTSADDIVNGGKGFDVYSLHGQHSAYRLLPSAKSWTIASTSATDGTDVLYNIEQLAFIDRSVLISSREHGSYADLPDSLYQFFITAFNAAPGVTYMDQLADAYRYGLSVKQIVEIFTSKSQFTDVYLTSMSAAQLAQALVNNIIKTSATDTVKLEAVKDITDAMTLANWSVGQVIYQVFGNLTNFAYTDPKWGNTAKQFANEIAVAKTYTDILGQSTTDMATLRSVMTPVSHLSDVSTPELQISLIGQALLA